jgi:myo-inositol-1(or 4)-monophosphatase
MSDLDSYLDVAITAAKAAGAEILAALSQPREARYKGYRDIVTETDLRAEQAIVGTIGARFPDHRLVTEEGSSPESATGHDQHADLVWYVDPLDGTTNFVHGFPLFCTSVALRQADRTLVGVVYDPLQEHLFTARAGAGAWLNGHRLQVSQRRRLEEALVALDWAHDPARRDRSVAYVSTLAPQVITLRAFGSAVLALCGVAAGWLDGYFNLALYDWDVAAAELFIREAGGQVTGLEGAPWHPGMRGCLASNGHVHQDLLALLKGP